MPSSTAIAAAMSLFHSVASVMNPSSLTCTSLPAMTRVAIRSFLLVWGFWSALLGHAAVGPARLLPDSSLGAHSAQHPHHYGEAPAHVGVAHLPQQSAHRCRLHRLAEPLESRDHHDGIVGQAVEVLGGRGSRPPGPAPGRHLWRERSSPRRSAISSVVGDPSRKRSLASGPAVCGQVHQALELIEHPVNVAAVSQEPLEEPAGGRRGRCTPGSPRVALSPRPRASLAIGRASCRKSERSR